ncbi:MAG: glycosyltransferase family 4 protein [Deltaproteobacteria bacterium]|nr:glycosyltransferase family 4 protein [Deltaproteobacteria bacterium]
MTAPRLFQLLASLNPADAVSDFARELADHAASLGAKPRLVAARVHPSCSGEAAVAGSTSPDQLAGRYDVLLYHHSIGAGLVGWVSRFPGRRIVVHHSVTPPRYFESWAPRLADATRRGVEELTELARVTSSALGVSEFDAAEARAAGFVDVGVLPISPCRSRLMARPARALSRRLAEEPGPRILCLGRLAPNKRVELVIGAFALVASVLPTARLEIVGSDAGTEGYALALRLLARDLGVPRVTFHGAMTDRELAALFATASVLVSASEHEGCGLPFLEAMFHGVPVVGRAATAIPETVSTAGLLLEGDHPEVWADAMLSVVRDRSLRERLVAAGRDRIRARLATDPRHSLGAILGARVAHPGGAV